MTTKRPKLTHTKLPMMFFRLGTGSLHSMRYRIIYPDGRCQWQDGMFISRFDDHRMLPPCWANKTIGLHGPNGVTEKYGKCSSARDAIRKMNQYDKDSGAPKAIFLGYIK